MAESIVQRKSIKQRFDEFYHAGKYVNVDIDIFSLPSRHSSFYNSLPNIAAIYFFVDNNEVLYIGHSQTLKKRIQTHKSKYYADKFFTPTSKIYFLEKYIRMDLCHGCVEESAFIQKFKPAYNTQTPIRTWQKTDILLAYAI